MSSLGLPGLFGRSCFCWKVSPGTGLNPWLAPDATTVVAAPRCTYSISAINWYICIYKYWWYRSCTVDWWWYTWLLLRSYTRKKIASHLSLLQACSHSWTWITWVKRLVLSVSWCRSFLPTRIWTLNSELLNLPAWHMRLKPRSKHFERPVAKIG